jgi:hypothetical protein
VPTLSQRRFSDVHGGHSRRQSLPSAAHRRTAEPSSIQQAPGGSFGIYAEPGSRVLITGSDIAPAHSGSYFSFWINGAQFHMDHTTVSRGGGDGRQGCGMNSDAGRSNGLSTWTSP